MTKTRIIVRTILRIIRSVVWANLAIFAVYTIVYLENATKQEHGVGLSQIEFSLVELFAVFCCALAVDRFLSLGEKPVDEHD